MAVTENTVTRTGIRSRGAIVGITVVAALAVWAVLAPLAGLDLAAMQGSSTIQIGGISVGVASAVAGVAGWGLLSLLERRTDRARRSWTIVALIVLVLSLGSPLASGMDIGAKLGLAALHLTVGAVLIPGLRRTAS